MPQTYGIHWFRRDLRLAGNAALLRSCTAHAGRVLGIFCVDSKILMRDDFSHDRFAFILATLRSLQIEMQKAGGQLLVVDSVPELAFQKLFEGLKSARVALPSTLSFNRDYEPFALRRDQLVTSSLEASNVEVLTEADHLVLEPHQVLKDNGEPYKVFTPYSRKWFERFQTDDIQRNIKQAFAKPNFSFRWEEIFSTAQPFSDALESTTALNAKHAKIELPPAGHSAALKALEIFRPKVGNYDVQRDFPAVPGTSHFSVYLKNGSLTVAQIINKLDLADCRVTQKNSATRFLKELVWREFYYSILFHFPQVETQSFIEKYRELPWENDKKHFEAWKNGQTGFPIVDAAMRQLNKTGWMHNRLRMIVASFLTKDLLVDWRWGERYFMEKLLDGDLAANNGGWQWAASTGCDPQPYFRIFNPLLQSKKFDPKGDFIRKYVPEIAHLSNRDLHAPPLEKRGEYPRPVVVHDQQRNKALRLFKSV